VPRPPATRDQVDAYRYGLRRMESALVRGDGVPLHEGLRSQRRAAFAGMLLALLALCGVAVHAALFPAKDWRQQALVVGAGSGAMYAVGQDPLRLVPVANAAAGRLVLAALGVAGGARAVPVTVADDDIATAPRTATAAVPGAFGVRPVGPGAPARWAVCDTVATDGRIRLVGTTVVAGAAPAGPAGPGPAVLVRAAGDAYYAVVDGRRYRVDVTDRALLDGLEVDVATARPAGDGLVSAIPEGPVLARPALPAGPPPAALSAQVGDVLTAGDRRYVVLPGAVQEVPQLLARVLAASAGRVPVEVSDATVAAVPRTTRLRVDGWPAPPTGWAKPAETPVLCWNWAPDGSGVAARGTLPVPAGAATVDLAQADGAGGRVDSVVIGTGAGGPVRASAPGRPAGTGTLWLISTTGVVYGVASDATATALGVGRAEPAPEAALRLLPPGPALDVAAVTRVVDVPAG